jgi:hypothetical protein
MNQVITFNLSLNPNNTIQIDFFGEKDWYLNEIDVSHPGGNAFTLHLFGIPHTPSSGVCLEVTGDNDMIDGVVSTKAELLDFCSKITKE